MLITPLYRYAQCKYWSVYPLHEDLISARGCCRHHRLRTYSPTWRSRTVEPGWSRRWATQRVLRYQSASQVKSQDWLLPTSGRLRNRKGTLKDWNSFSKEVDNKNTKTPLKTLKLLLQQVCPVLILDPYIRCRRTTILPSWCKSYQNDWYNEPCIVLGTYSVFLFLATIRLWLLNEWNSLTRGSKVQL